MYLVSFPVIHNNEFWQKTCLIDDGCYDKDTKQISNHLHCVLQIVGGVPLFQVMDGGYGQSGPVEAVEVTGINRTTGSSCGAGHMHALSSPPPPLSHPLFILMSSPSFSVYRQRMKERRNIFLFLSLSPLPLFHALLFHTLLNPNH